MIRGFSKDKHNGSTCNGFTLIELLVVVAIIGILVAIAVPQFATYRRQASDSVAKSQIRYFAMGAESRFTTTDTYIGISEATLAACCGYTTHPDITVTVPAAAGAAVTLTTWSASATHTRGTGAIFVWDSTLGGMQ